MGYVAVRRDDHAPCVVPSAPVMPVDYDPETALPLRVSRAVRERLDALRALAPAWAPLSRNGAGVAAVMLGLEHLEAAMRADPTAAARLLAGETIATSSTPSTTTPPTGADAGALPPRDAPRREATPAASAPDTATPAPRPARAARPARVAAPKATEHVEGDDAALRARLVALLATEPDKHPRDKVWNLRRIGRAIGADNKSLAAFRDGKPGLGPQPRGRLRALLDAIDAGTATPPT